jgi:L-lactate dehydrogenase complex protein LldF
MTLHPTTPAFKENAHEALHDRELQKALGHVQGGFIYKRQSAVDRLPEFDILRDAARDLKDHVLAHLDLYLEMYEARVRASGGHVHFARDAAEANKIIVDICKAPRASPRARAWSRKRSGSTAPSRPPA